MTTSTDPLTPSPNDRAIAARIFDAADEGGTVQGDAMVGLGGDPTMHCATNMWRVADYHGPRVRAALAEIVGFEPESGHEHPIGAPLPYDAVTDGPARVDRLGRAVRTAR